MSETKKTVTLVIEIDADSLAREYKVLAHLLELLQENAYNVKSIDEPKVPFYNHAPGVHGTLPWATPVTSVKSKEN